MFNLFPGQGLGIAGTQLISFGLGPVMQREVPLETVGGGGFYYPSPRISLRDNAYSYSNDDEEVLMIMNVILQVIN